MKNIIKEYLSKIIDLANSKKEITDIMKFDMFTTSQEIVELVGKLALNKNKAKKKRIGEIVLPIVTSYEKLIKFIDGATQFYVSSQSNLMDIVQAFYNIEYVDKNHFDQIDILLDKFIITYEKEGHKNVCDDQYLTCSSVNIEGKEEKVYQANHFIGAVNYIGFYFLPSKLPRIYINCMYVNDKEKCTVSNPIKIDNMDYCMKTNRTCRNCPITQELRDEKDNNKPINATLAEMAYSMLLVVYHLMSIFGAEPEEVVKIKDSISIRREYHKQNKSDTSDELDMIVLKKKRYKYMVIGGGTKRSSSRSGDGSINRSSPCQHVRRGHYRRYKSGKIIYVKDNIINAGKGNNKIIKV